MSLTDQNRIYPVKIVVIIFRFTLSIIDTLRILLLCIIFRVSHGIMADNIEPWHIILLKVYILMFIYGNDTNLCSIKYDYTISTSKII